VLEERCDAEGLDSTPHFHYGDCESFLLEIPLKAQDIDIEEVVEHIPSSPTEQTRKYMHLLNG
jgi:hypothetical protein